MKKILAITMTVLFLLSLCGCNPNPPQPQDTGLSMEELLQKLEANDIYADYDSFTMLRFDAEQKQIRAIVLVDISDTEVEELDVMDVHYEGDNVYRMEVAYGEKQTDCYLTFADEDMTSFVLKDSDGVETTFVIDKGYTLDELLDILKKGNYWLEPNQYLMCTFKMDGVDYNLWRESSSWGADGNIEEMVHYGVDCYGLWCRLSLASGEMVKDPELVEVEIKLGHHPEESIRIIIDNPSYNVDGWFYADNGAALK